MKKISGGSVNEAAHISTKHTPEPGLANLRACAKRLPCAHLAHLSDNSNFSKMKKNCANFLFSKSFSANFELKVFRKLWIETLNPESFQQTLD